MVGNGSSTKKLPVTQPFNLLWTVFNCDSVTSINPKLINLLPAIGMQSPIERPNTQTAVFIELILLASETGSCHSYLEPSISSIDYFDLIALLCCELLTCEYGMIRIWSSLDCENVVIEDCHWAVVSVNHRDDFCKVIFWHLWGFEQICFYLFIFVDRIVEFSDCFVDQLIALFDCFVYCFFVFE